MLEAYFQFAQWFFTIYFIGLHGGYLILNGISVISIRKYMEQHSVNNLPNIYTGMEMPISLLVPAYNEELSIIDSVLALLQVNYPDYEIIVINDGSNDNTLQVIKDYFELTIFPEAQLNRLKTQPVNNIYISKKYKNLRVIDKKNGGKADSLNAGINVSRFPLFCAIDADSILQSNSIERIVQTFLEDPRTIAAGGSVRIVNGCEIHKGFVTKANLPKNPLALMQVAEYLRAFLFGRLGWSPLNALLIISGAFGLFKKEAVVHVGGYKPDTIGEDMELIVRMHRVFRSEKKSYRITFVPDPICWTEAPEDLKTLKNQRIRWQRGLSESLMGNLNLMFNRNPSIVGWIAMPYMLIFELAGPIIELMGISSVVIGFIAGYISYEVALLFFTIAIGFGMLLSIIGVLLEEMSFHIYSNPMYVIKLFIASFTENFGYRQLNSFWRMIAMFQIITGSRAKWAKMKRNANWQSKTSSEQDSSE